MAGPIAKKPAKGQVCRTARAVAEVAARRPQQGPEAAKELEGWAAQQLRPKATKAKTAAGTRATIGMRPAVHTPQVPAMLLEAIGDVMNTPRDLCYLLKLVESMVAEGWMSYSAISRAVAEQGPPKKGLFHHSMAMNWRKMLCVFLFGNGEGGMPRASSGRNAGEGPSQAAGVAPEQMVLPRRLYTTLAGAPSVGAFCMDWAKHTGENFDRNTSMMLIKEYECQFGEVYLE